VRKTALKSGAVFLFENCSLSVRFLGRECIIIYTCCFVSIYFERKKHGSLHGGRRIAVQDLPVGSEIIRKKDTVTLQSELRHSESVERFVVENQSELGVMSVSEYLNELLIKYNIEKCDVAKRGGFNGNYPYQIFNGKKNASRDKLIQIALGFPLSIEETQYLLQLGGYLGLYVRNSRDAFIMYAVEKQYTLEELNELLYANKKKMIE